MTYRARRQAKPGLRTRLGGLIEGEERQQLAVSLLFFGAIVAVLLMLVGAVAIAWYNDNLRPLGRVGSVEIGPGLLRAKVDLEQWRIERDQDRVTQAQINGEIDADTAQARLSALQQQSQALSTQALEDLIDVIYQSQLASQEGLSASPADVDARLAREFAGLERRHLLLIKVEPHAADAEAGPTVSEQHGALAKAQEALGKIDAGTDWATVAHDYSTDPTGPTGGDLGLVTRDAISDLEFMNVVFDLDQGGTTGIVRGDDGTYRIGRVIEIQTAPEETGLRDRLFESVSESSVRQLLTYEAAAAAVKDKITDQALAGTPEQVRIAVIYVEGLATGDPDEAEGEVNYSEIVFAPNDDILTAPDLPAEDQAWTAAQTEAQAAYDELAAITDIEQRKTRFADMAAELSDSDTGLDGGEVGFVTRNLPPTTVGDLLFTGTHQESDLVGGGPVRDEAAYYVLMFNERRDSPDARLQAVKDALVAPGADFNELARELSDGPEKDDGGEIGWLTRDQLATDIGDKVFPLDAGQVSEPIQVSQGYYFVKVEEKAARPLDPDQIPQIRASAYLTWYDEKKTAAEADGTIVRADEESVAPIDVTGGDQPTP